MPNTQSVVHPELTLEELVAFQDDISKSLQSYFKSKTPDYELRFAGESEAVVQQLLVRRMVEAELRSTFFLLTSLEASFRIDFDARCKKRLKDDLSRYFRQVATSRGDRVRLDEDILEGWKLHTSASGQLISHLRGALKLRHWLAHGRYWTPKLGLQYDFDYVFTFTTAIVYGFPFES